MPWRAPFAALVVALTLTGCAGDSGDRDASTTTTGPISSTSAEAPAATTTAAPEDDAIEVRLSGGRVEGGPRRETVAVGDRVTIRAVADVAEELHVHTYDLTVEITPGEPDEISFDATIPGRHEVEFERSGKVALTLEVR